MERRREGATVWSLHFPPWAPREEEKKRRLTETTRRGGGEILLPLSGCGFSGNKGNKIYYVPVQRMCTERDIGACAQIPKLPYTSRTVYVQHEEGKRVARVRSINVKQKYCTAQSLERERRAIILCAQVFGAEASFICTAQF